MLHGRMKSWVHRGDRVTSCEKTESSQRDERQDCTVLKSFLALLVSKIAVELIIRLLFEL